MIVSILPMTSIATRLLFLTLFISTISLSIESSSSFTTKNQETNPIDNTISNSGTATGNVASSASSSSVPPNIVVIITDDLDLTLGGINASTLIKTRNLIAKYGTTISNWFAQTPVCCPSRAELLTGKMFHNLRTKTDQRNNNIHQCMHVNVSSNLNHSFYRKDYFAKYFSLNKEMNYTVGIFGKHLNLQNPNNCPLGVDRFFINGGGQYLNPTFTSATRGIPPKTITYNNCTTTTTTSSSSSSSASSNTTSIPCYSTSIIGNVSIAWIRDHIASTQQQQQQQSGQPFFAYISVKAPHLQDEQNENEPGTYPQAIPAPWYDNNTTIIPEIYAPRTPNYNHTCKNHHWLVRNQEPLTTLEGQMVDTLYRSRLLTLLSVDDLVEELIQTLDTLQVLNNTYIIFTSDNGFRLGQYSIPEGKLHAYENDIRVPMIIRGPYIPSNTINTNIFGTHVDLMPTLLGLSKLVMEKRREGSSSRRNTFDGFDIEQESNSKTTTHNDNEDLDDDAIPETMDGTNLAMDLVRINSATSRNSKSNMNGHDIGNGNSNIPKFQQQKQERRQTKTKIRTRKSGKGRDTGPTSISLLIEYMSLGDVLRYDHLMDTNNHTFLALRMTMIESDNMFEQQKHKKKGKKVGNKSQFSDYGDTDHMNTYYTDDDNVLVLRDIKYVEYRDGRIDWEFRKKPIEIELFDLERDPYEMTNLISGEDRSSLSVKVDGTILSLDDLISKLHQKAMRLFHCVGHTCRVERYSGLDFDYTYSKNNSKVH